MIVAPVAQRNVYSDQFGSCDMCWIRWIDLISTEGYKKNENGFFASCEQIFQVILSKIQPNERRAFSPHATFWIFKIRWLVLKLRQLKVEKLENMKSKYPICSLLCINLIFGTFRSTRSVLKTKHKLKGYQCDHLHMVQQ